MALYESRSACLRQNCLEQPESEDIPAAPSKSIASQRRDFRRNKEVSILLVSVMRPVREPPP
jgi:hypothetical protein